MHSEHLFHSGGMWHSRWFVCLLLVVLAAGAILAGCYTNPATGKEQLSLIPQSQEVQMGREAAKEVDQTLGLYQDTVWQNYIQRLGMKLAAVSERPDLPWSFKIVDDPTVNAFALPGGFIYVTRGMLYYAENEAELAGVVGHEIGHVTARHSVNQLSKQQLAQLGLMAGTMIEPDIQKYSNLINTGLGLLFLKFSRDDEKQADDLGLRYMAKVGYDPRQMDDIFQMLERISQTSGGGRVPEWLSTHPNPENRYQRIQDEIKTIEATYHGTTVNRKEYLRRLNGIVYGNNPREGFFEGSVFYHPDMKFVFTFPQDWKTLNQKQGVIAGSQEGDAILQLSISASSNPDAASKAFFDQQGISGQSVGRQTVNGLSGVSGSFTAETQQGMLQGKAVFVAYEGKVFEIVGYSTQEKWPSYDRMINSSMFSFAPLTDQSKLSVQPMRVEIVTTSRSMTLDQFATTFPSPINIQTLAIINQVTENAQIKSGTEVKRIVGKPVGD